MSSLAAPPRQVPHLAAGQLSVFPSVTIISFGYGHGPPPAAHITYDLRWHFKDPHVRPELRQLTALDREVLDAVRQTAGVTDLVTAIAATVVCGYRRGPQPGEVRVAIGCAGGRHRSAAVAIMVAAVLRDDDVPVQLEHRDLRRPVIPRPPARV